MRKAIIIFFLGLMFSTFFLSGGIMAEDSRDIIHLVLKDGTVVIETRPDLAPKHVAQIKQLISEKQYDGVVFHRVIEGFMAQTGDVQFGNSSSDKFDLRRAGTGSSNLPDLKQEFSELKPKESFEEWAKLRLHGLSDLDIGMTDQEERNELLAEPVRAGLFSRFLAKGRNLELTVGVLKWTFVKSF